MATLWAITSDHHCGSTVALCPPSIDLDDGGRYEASPAQRELWKLWLGYWEWIAQLQEKHSAKLYMEFNGDITDGNHHGTTQILSGNPTVQAHVVDDVMRVPLSMAPDKMFFVRGTEAHVGPSAAYEERIALGLQKDGRPVEGDPDNGKASWWHLQAETEGVRLSFQHHGRMGQRPWTQPNVVANLAAEIFYEYCKDGVAHPHIAVRSHYHRHVDTYDQHPVRVIQTPAWQLATAYVHKIAAETIADMGGIAILCRDGTYEVFKYIHRPGRGHVWKP